MKYYLLLLLPISFILSCSNENPEPGTDIIVGIYQGGGTYADNNLNNFIFNTKVNVSKSNDGFLIELENNKPAPTITLPEKIYVKINETKNEVFYFNIIENPECKETPSNGVDDFNCFDLREEPDIAPRIILNLDITGLDPNNPYQLWFMATKPR